ncbi:MFS transporter [Saccharopolyspora rosea]|uniref:MFS transporter n=1 Tax=Saccharopolyspora rosea TaxID=524884 RepID=UPI0021DA942B|nr:MFS transporter [Saccharopolyspora rosea]
MVRSRSGFVALLPVRTRVLLVGNFVSSLGSGLVQPFLVIYLTEVRGIDVGSATSVVAVFAAASLVGAPLSGWLTDHVSLRTAAAVAAGLSAAGSACFAWTHSVPVAALAAGLHGAGYGGLATVWTTSLSRNTSGRQRTVALGCNFIGLNLGVGLGGVLAGIVVSTRTPGVFELLYLLDAGSFVLVGCVLWFATRDGLSAVDGAARAGVRNVLAGASARPELLHLLAFTCVLMLFGYGQFESTIPAIVSVSELDPRTMAWAFVGNTAVVVVGQFVVLTRLANVPRTRLIGGIAACWALCWCLVLAATAVSGTGAELLVIAGVAVFALGEVLIAPSLPTMVNELADESVRGRYNAAYQWAMSVGLVGGPLLSSLFFRFGNPTLLLVVLLAGCALPMGYARYLSRRLPAELVLPRPDDEVRESNAQ